MNSNQNLNENLNPSENQKTSGSSESRSEINIMEGIVWFRIGSCSICGSKNISNFKASFICFDCGNKEELN